MNGLATLQDPVADSSPEGENMPPLPPWWTLRESAAFVFLACALQVHPCARTSSGLQEDYEAARSELQGLELNIHPSGAKSEQGMLMASRFFESLLRVPNPGSGIALEGSRHVAELSRLGMETIDKWILPMIHKLAGNTGTDRTINETIRDIARHLWGSAKEAAQIQASGRSISREKAEEDMGKLLQIQVKAYNWSPGQDLSWETSRRIVSPGFWDQVRKLFSK